MKLFEIAGWIEKTAPLDLQESYDNSGLIIGSLNHEVSRAVVCLDVDDKVIAFARENGAELIISHHPCVFKEIKVFNPDSLEGKVLFAAIQGNIAVYSAHTNFDSVRGGMGDILCERIGLESASVLKPGLPHQEHGIGRVGIFDKPVEFKEFVGILRKKLNIVSFREVGIRPEKVGKVAVANGSFDKSLIPDLVKQKPEVLLTGDLKYHDALDLKYRGIYSIDAGHYKTEVIFVEELPRMIRDAFPELTVLAWEGEDIFRSNSSID